MFMKRSAPQPAIMKTPTGGTEGEISQLSHSDRKHSFHELWRRPGGSLQRMVMRIRRIAEMGFSPAICGGVFWL